VLRPVGELADFPKTAIAVAMAINDIGGTHVGILYHFENSILLCHLPGPFGAIPDGHITADYSWQVATLDQDDTTIVINFIRLLQRGQVPYGFGYSGFYFDGNANWVRVGDVGAGLTCSTFIMAIYQTLDLPFIR
jgi:hypothetical protein